MFCFVGRTKPLSYSLFINKIKPFFSLRTVSHVNKRSNRDFADFSHPA